MAIALIALTNGCKKKPPKYIIHDVKPFQSLILQIKNNGKPLNDSTLAHTLLYYYDHNRYVDKPDDIEQGDKTIYDDKYLMSYFAGKLAGIGLVSSPYIAPVSAEGITQKFYLWALNPYCATALFFLCLFIGENGVGFFAIALCYDCKSHLVFTRK